VTSGDDILMIFLIYQLTKVRISIG